LLSPLFALIYILTLEKEPDTPDGQFSRNWRIARKIDIACVS